MRWPYDRRYPPGRAHSAARARRRRVPGVPNRRRGRAHGLGRPDTQVGARCLRGGAPGRVVSRRRRLTCWRLPGGRHRRPPIALHHPVLGALPLGAGARGFPAPVRIALHHPVLGALPSTRCSSRYQAAGECARRSGVHQERGRAPRYVRALSGSARRRDCAAGLHGGRSGLPALYDGRPHLSPLPAIGGGGHAGVSPNNPGRLGYGRFGGVAQPGRALRSHRRSRRFKSGHLHQLQAQSPSSGVIFT